MIWSIIVPAASLIFFFVWMLRITLRSQGLLGHVAHEVDQIARVLVELKSVRHVDTEGENWLADMYAYITRNSFASNNPLLELLSRFNAVRNLANTDVSAMLESISEREIDKLEPVRETPGSLLLLGIMGTVVGMVIALTTFGAGGLLGGEAGIDIRRIVSSMFLAFISTGIALFLSVYMRSRLERVAQRQSDMLAELESYAYTHLSPALLPKNDRAVQERFHELMDRQQRLLGRSLEQSASTLDQFSTTIHEAQVITQTLSDSIARNAAALEEASDQTTTQLGRVSREMSDKLLEALRLLNGELSQQRTSLEAVHQETRLAIEEERKSTLRQAETLRQNSASTLNLLEVKNRELIGSLNNLTTHLSAHVSEQTESIRALREEVSRLSERLTESQERYQKTFLETVQSFLQEQFSELAKSFGLQRR